MDDKVGIVWNWLQQLWEFARENAEFCGLLLTVAGGAWAILSGRAAALWLCFKPRTQSSLPISTFPFVEIPPRSRNVLQQLMPDSRGETDPLAEFNIPYQARRSDRNVRRELEQAFVEKPWVLILGKSGLGKTREASHLAELLNGEGWTVLKLSEQGWLDEPRQFPSSLSPTDKLLFFLDDLNRWCYRGNPREVVSSADDSSQPLRVPVQERLLRTLAFFERECRLGHVRVIATARNETVPDRDGDVSPIEMLQWERYREFWQRFYCYELAEPSSESVVNLLSDRVAATHLAGKPEDYEGIARRNDGTFRNIIENLRKAQNRQLTVSLDEFSEHLDQTWRQHYNTAVERYPTAKLIYDAVEVLRRLNLSLSPELVAETANLLSQKRGVGVWRQKRQINRALSYLRQAENILRPKDGQIEAKKTPLVPLEAYVHRILQLLVQVGKQYPQPFLVNEFFDCGNALYELGRNEDAISSYDKALRLKPDDCAVWNNRGVALSALGYNEDAISSYDKALRLKPNYHEALNNLGNALLELGRKEDALFSYDKALKVKPDDCAAWNNRGVALLELGRKEDALFSYDKALEHKPGNYRAWDNRGDVLIKLKRYEEAVVSYDQAITLKPDYRFPHHGRGFALMQLGRYDEATHSFDRAIALKADYERAWYNKACCYSLLGEVELAVETLARAIELAPEGREMAKTDVSFDGIRDDQRFRELIEPPEAE